MIGNRRASNFHLGRRKAGRRRGHTEGRTLRNIDMAHGSARGV